MLNRNKENYGKVWKTVGIPKATHQLLLDNKKDKGVGEFADEVIRLGLEELKERSKDELSLNYIANILHSTKCYKKILEKKFEIDKSFKISDLIQWCEQTKMLCRMLLKIHDVIHKT